MHDNRALSCIAEPANPPNSALVVQAIAPELRDDIEGAYSLNTARAYRADWRDWCAWCERSGVIPTPAAPRAVRDYLVDLAAGKKVSTLRRRLAAIARAHKIAGYQFDRSDPVIQHAMRRLARELGTAPKGRDALMTADLVGLLKLVPNTLRGTRDRAILLIVFAGGLRRSEAVDLNINDLEWRRDGIAVHLRKSKTDQAGAGELVLVEYGKRESTCPVRALKAWLAGAKVESGAIFRLVTGATALPDAVSDQLVWRLIKRYGARAGLDVTMLGAHSLRAGHVTQALENGAELAKVKEQLRHRRLETTLGYNRGRSFKGNSSGKLDL